MQTQSPARGASPDGDSHAHASSLVRLLSRRYLLVLVAVALLVIVDQAIIQPLLVGLNFYAPAINVAGRQRMLSQKLTKDALALATGGAEEVTTARRAELIGTIEQWSAAHRALLKGDRKLGLQPLDAPHVTAALRELEPSLAAMTVAAKKIAGPVTSPNELSAPIAEMLNQEPRFLRGMERVVAMLEVSAGRRINLLRLCGLAAMAIVLGLLVAVYFLVLRPATGLIRAQVEQLATSDTRHRLLADMLRDARDELELRVAQRTSELTAANITLEREMAERQAAELRMRDLSTELAYASRVTALGQLATGLAHEINQPLATVANCAGTLELNLERACPNNQETQRLVSQIKHAALRAGAIVRRMRNFVRGGAVQASQVDLNELVREVSELCRPQIDETSVQLSVDLSPRPIVVFADALQIQQVLVNLFQNAIQAMAATAVARRGLHVSTSVRLDVARVEVSDTGPGFPVESMKNAFDPFFSTKRDGLGMGLAISRSIIQKHQGRIWSENRENGGAVVSFSLPLLRAHDASTELHAHSVCG